MYVFKHLTMEMTMLKFLWIMTCHKHKLFLVMGSVHLHLAIQGFLLDSRKAYDTQHNESCYASSVNIP